MVAEKTISFSEEAIESVLVVVTKFYIDNDGKMPTDRQIKKSNEIDGENYALMRRFIPNKVSERVIRERALTAGYEFISPEERHLKGLKNVQKKREVVIDVNNSDCSVFEKNKEKGGDIDKVTSSKRGKRANLAEVLVDFEALMWRLGHVPTVAEIRDKANGAHYSYETYKHYVGGKGKWKMIWADMMKRRRE